MTGAAVRRAPRPDAPLRPADAAFADSLARRLPPDTIRPVEPRHGEEPRRLMRGTSAFVARPRTVEEVAAIVAACAEARVALIPYGGWTGLVGGQLSDGAPALLVSTERMSAIRAVRPDEGTMTVEAGAILADVHEAAAAEGLVFPPTLGARGSARIGGLLSTNAGGTAVLRYGTMRELTLGLEAVLPDGSVMRTAHRLRKANLGYDLRHLLIGAEGTLGVITAATLRLYPEPRDAAAAFLALPGPEAALAVLARLRAVLGDAVSGCELIDGQGLRWLGEIEPDRRQPFATPPDWSLLVEATSQHADMRERLESAIGDALDAGLVTGGVIARSERERAEFWAVREGIPEASRAIGPIASHDVSVPLDEIAGLIRDGRAALGAIAPDLRFNTFGHVGDGNLHYNLFPAEGRTREDYADIKAALTARLHDLVVERGGAISAEHGIGRFKAHELARLHDPAALAAMRAIKRALDPLGIMNPGAVLCPAREDVPGRSVGLA